MSKSEEIKKVIETLDKNIQSLEQAEEITLQDVKEFLIDLMGSTRDMWEEFSDIFIRINDIKEKDKDNEEEKNSEIPPEKVQDIKGLYL